MGHLHLGPKRYVKPFLCSMTTKKSWKLHIDGPFVMDIHRWLMYYPHKEPVMCKSFPYHYAIRDELVSMG